MPATPWASAWCRAGWSHFGAPAVARTRELQVCNSPSVLRAVRRAEADIGFVESIDPTADLDSLAVARDKIVVVVGSRHPWAACQMIDAEALVDEPYLAREAGSGTRAVAESGLARHGLRLVPILEADSSEGLKRAVTGGGFTLLSLLTVEHEVAAGQLSTLCVQGVDLRRELPAVRRWDRTPSRAANMFWTWVREAAGPPAVTGAPRQPEPEASQRGEPRASPLGESGAPPSAVPGAPEPLEAAPEEPGQVLACL